MVAIWIGFVLLALGIKRAIFIINKIYEEFENSPDNTKEYVAGLHLEQQSMIDALYFKKDGYRTPILLLTSGASFFIASRIYHKDWLWFGILIWSLATIFTLATYLASRKYEFGKSKFN